MERGMVVGGVLIAASLLLALVLHHCQGESVLPAKKANAQVGSDALVVQRVQNTRSHQVRGAVASETKLVTAQRAVDPTSLETGTRDEIIF